MNDERILRHVYEYSPVFLVVVSKKDGTIMSVSDNFERITGFPKKDALGLPITALGLWNGAVMASLLRLSGAGRKVMHIPVRLRNGEEKDFTFTVEEDEIFGTPSLVLAGMQKPATPEYQQVGVVADAAAREQAFPTHEARWCSIFDALHDISQKFITTSLTDDVVIEVLEIFGSAVDALRSYVFELLGEMNFLSVVRWAWNSPGSIRLEPGFRFDASPIASDSRDFITLLSERKVVSVKPKDLPALRRGGNILEDTAVITIFPVFLGGRLWGFTGFDFGDEISPLTNMEKGGLSIFADVFGAALLRRSIDEQSDRTFKVMSRILDTTDALIYVARMDTHEILFVNRYGKNIYGDVVGKRCWEVFHGSSHAGPCHDCSNRWLLKSDGSPAGSSFQSEYRDEKTRRWYQCLDSAIEWIDGSIVRIETAFDITDRKALEDRLKETLAARDTFFSVISHDLKNPIAGLKGVSESLYQDFESFGPHDVREIARGMNLTVAKILDLLEDLLSWSRVQRGAMPFHPRLLFPSALAENLRRLFQETADRKGLTMTLAGPIDLAVLADYDMISAVLRNLLANALKFTPRGGTIACTVRRDPRREKAVEISVRDDGIGMSRETLGRLFRIDQLFSNPGTEGEEGTGLGLILCRDFLARHGSAIEVESVPGKGTRFSFSLPAAAIPASCDEKK